MYIGAVSAGGASGISSGAGRDMETPARVKRPKPPTGFALFVKENYAVVKAALAAEGGAAITHAATMKELSRRWNFENGA